tara:strand:- start:950 stop:1477 length:528 start_codon:yes stop_codon:yes gene_type:complete
MHPIIYDVAVSLDGYISGKDGDISKFAHDGPVVEDYMSRMAGYATAVMGRATYEFGYRFGLEPGQNPYPHMTTIVLSNTFQNPENSSVSAWASADAERIRSLKKTASGPIYLCGGGALAGWMLEEGLIDGVILKRAPCLYGEGVSLFGNRQGLPALSRIKTKTYDNGYLLEEFLI